MPTVYAITCQKGGTGKTTTAQTLAAGLRLEGKKVLSVDLDPQANLSFCVGADGSAGHATTLGVLTGEVKAAAAIQHTALFGDILPAGRTLAAAETALSSTGKEYRLRENLVDIVGGYDFVIFDTPPSLGVLTVNALTAADRVLIPVQADVFSLQGVQELARTMQGVQRYTHPGLRFDGILLTRFNPRTNMGAELRGMFEALAQKMGGRLYKSTIREAVAIKEAQLQQTSIFAYAPAAAVTQDYRGFLSELLGR